ncbi:nitroreductase [Nitrosopumilus cobalaminigenes]|uniref:Nitroreductase n=1 Tax=Nitrosopumilus cobalaminigenes TaxID=1470066 RepID=A0A7D5M2R6_9ARCH|nr:nitroreductase family protein [Nitrosopumilus cobalaminigenes]QLH03347.1 nitroreductase [Nitrosopumilus cobalaminigenes]
MKFQTIEPSYTSKDGCRLVWQGVDEDDTDVVILNKKELENLVDIFAKNSTGDVELEDQSSIIRVNSDVTQFTLTNHRLLEAKTNDLQEKVLDFAKIPHEPQYVYVGTKEFYPSVWIRDDEKSLKDVPGKSPKVSLIQAILSSEPEKIRQDLSPTDLFRVFATRRSTRKFEKTKVEDWKVDKILSAADVAPTAGNFQGFQVFLIKNKDTKQALVEAANKQPYVNAPIVLVFCTDPSRVKLKFPPEILEKFSLQDATIAATFSLLAASGVGLSTIWIGMFDEEKVKTILGTDLKPSSILCIGYPDKKKPPKSRRKLKELIKVIE